MTVRPRLFLLPLFLLLFAAPAAAAAQGQEADDPLGLMDDTMAVPQAQRVMPAGGDFPAGDDQRPAAVNGDDGLRPFGASLFADPLPADRALGVNPDYEIMPGDRIAVQIWGARNVQEVLPVDLQGNIFLPEIGPVRVGGLRNAQLNDAVRAQVRSVYSNNVQVYTNLLSTQPVGVYVTGAVRKPGRYPGERSDSLLYFLARAGGIDPERGSYREVLVKRGGEVVARADLYRFLLEGELPTVTFRDNDTVMVRMRGASVAIDGAVSNPARFEIGADAAAGADVMRYAQPDAEASHVLWQGVRQGRMMRSYMPLSDFAEVPLADGDHISIFADHVPDHIVVEVVGHGGGPSSFILPQGATLGTLAQLVEIDPEVAQTDAIYLRRESVARLQKQAIERSLYELQKSVLTVSSDTSSQATIRAREAELVERFVSQARAVQPEGRVVLEGVDWRGVRLEDGDEVVIPEKTNVVLVSGEVQMPQTVIWREGWAVEDYVGAAGGVGQRGDAENVLVMQANGAVHNGGQPVRPGDHLMVMPRVESKGFAVFKDVVEVIYRIALSSAVVLRAN